MLIEEKIIPVLIRPHDPRFHTTLYCQFSASSQKEEKVYAERLEGILVTTRIRAGKVHNKKPCLNDACQSVPYYDYHEGDCIE